MPDSSAARIMEVVRELSAGIGPRLSGSPAAKQAAEYLAGLLDGLGLDVELQPFNYVGWEYEQEPALELLSPVREPVECAAMAYSLATLEPLEGIVWRDGVVSFVPELFEFTRLAVGEDGYRRGSIYVPPMDGPPFPLPKMGAGARFGEPGLYVSRQDGVRMLGWLDQGAEVRVRMRTFGHHVPAVADTNVVGRLGGQHEGRIVVSSHFDSAWKSPGAQDNASGCAAMIEVARRMAQRDTQHAFEFVAFAAEEEGILGSEYFVLEAQHRGEIDLYRGVVNCDPLCAGDELSVWVGPDFLRRIADQVIDELGLRRGYKVSFTGPHAWSAGGSDHRPFSQRGVPTCFPIVQPFPAQYHQPSDTIDGVDPDTLLTIVEFADRVACALDRQDPPGQPSPAPVG